MLIIWILLCLFILIFAITTYKDMANPVFISGSVWLSVYFILAFTNYDIANSDIYYGSFFGGFLCFFIGFCIVTPKYKMVSAPIVFDIEWKQGVRKVIFVFEYLFSLYLLLTSASYFGTRSSIWTSMRSRNLPNMVESILTIIPVVFFVAWGMYLGNPTSNNKKCLFLTIPPLFVAMLFANRGVWFFVLITTVFLLVYIRRLRNRRILKYGIMGIAIIMILFIISSLDKFSNAWLWMNPVEKLKMLLEMYFVNPSIAFVNWLHSDFTLQYGKYTFRFICALLKPISPRIEVVNTVQNFVETNGILGNVYTALHWYTYDFGLWWAFVIQFALGFIYGSFYKMIRNKQHVNIFCVIFLSMLMHPLINQFFDEKFFSVMSIWMQRLIALFILTRPKLCVRKKYCETDSKFRKIKKIKFVI